MSRDFLMKCPPTVLAVVAAGLLAMAAPHANANEGAVLPPDTPGSTAAQPHLPDFIGGFISLFAPRSGQAPAPAVPAPTQRASGMPPANEGRFLADEVVIEVPTGTPPPVLAALEQRQGLTRIDQFASALTGATLLRSRITVRRPVRTVIATTQAEPVVLSAQPNYRFLTVQSSGAGAEQLQYALARLRLVEAHQLARGGNVPVALIDSGVDPSHPELAGAVAATYDAVGGVLTPDRHGTAIAGLIAAHGRLMGSAPAARILAARAFERHGTRTDGNTFGILRCLEWSVANGARVINMSFAGPADPDMHRALEGASRHTVVLVAAAGNAGPRAAPLFPAADPLVIAVAATDEDDDPLPTSSRGPHVVLAAPAADILVAAPGGAYQLLSGTSVAAAEVSGIVALMLEHRPKLGPDDVRAVLLGTAPAIAADSSTPTGLRMADAYMAVTTDPAAVAARGVTPVSTGGR